MPNLQYLHPNNSGSLTQILKQFPDEGFHWDKVVEMNEMDAIVINNSAELLTDLYEIENHSSYGKITQVTVLNVASCEDTNLCHITPVLRTYSTNYSEKLNIWENANEFKEFKTIYEKNPNTGQPWTWAEVDDLEIGTTLVGDKTGQASCTWVNAQIEHSIEWTGKIYGVTGSLKIYGVDVGNIIKVGNVGPT